MQTEHLLTSINEQEKLYVFLIFNCEFFLFDLTGPGYNNLSFIDRYQNHYKTNCRTYSNA